MSDPIRPLDALLGRDPLDSSMVAGAAARRGRESWWLSKRLALGLSATPVPGLLLVVGLALGPEGLNLLSRSVLSHLDPVISAALAALGLLVGLGLDLRRPRELRLLGAASLEAGLTILLVAAGALVVVARDPVAGLAPWCIALLLGVCAAASYSSPAVESGVLDSPARRIGDLDDVLPIVVGGLALTAIRAGTAAATAWLTFECVALAVAVTAAGSLLVARSDSESEQHVFTFGMVLLLGGISEFLGGSALFFGLLAGAFLRAVPGGAGERVGRDVRYIQHPLLVLLLLIAGARVAFTAPALVLALAYLVLRLAGKVAGATLLRRTVLREGGPHLGPSLLSPGVIAAAFALNVVQVDADPAGLVLAVAVAGSILSELVALLTRPQEPA